jgi:hypothetical protein
MSVRLIYIWIDVAYDLICWRTFVTMVTNLRVPRLKPVGLLLKKETVVRTFMSKEGEVIGRKLSNKWSHVVTLGSRFCQPYADSEHGLDMLTKASAEPTRIQLLIRFLYGDV